MEVGDRPSLAAFISRRYARGGPLVTWFVCQPAGGVVAHASNRAGLRPTALTAASLVLGVGGCAAFASAAASSTFALAGLLLVLSYVFDCADGQLARATQTSTARGAWLDILADATIVVALALAVLNQTLDQRWKPFAFLAALLLGAGRCASLITTVFGSRDAQAWRSKGILRVGRVAYVSLIDTPVVYVLLVSAGAAGDALLFAAATLGAASVVHAIVVGARLHSPHPQLSEVATSPP